MAFSENGVSHGVPRSIAAPRARVNARHASAALVIGGPEHRRRGQRGAETRLLPVGHGLPAGAAHRGRMPTSGRRTNRILAGLPTSDRRLLRSLVEVGLQRGEAADGVSAEQLGERGHYLDSPSSGRTAMVAPGGR